MGPTKEMCGSPLMAYKSAHCDMKQQLCGLFMWIIFYYLWKTSTELRGLELNIYIVMDAHNKQQ